MEFPVSDTIKDNHAKNLRRIRRLAQSVFCGDSEAEPTSWDYQRVVIMYHLFLAMEGDELPDFDPTLALVKGYEFAWDKMEPLENRPQIASFLAKPHHEVERVFAAHVR